MRTTVNLPEDVYEVVRSVALAKRVSFGEALADLVRKGLAASPRIESRTAFPSFLVDEDAPAITLEQTLKAEEEF